MWYWIFKYAVFGPLLKIFFPTTVIGRENIPESGAVIIASNHLAVVDSFITSANLRRRVTYLAKSEYFTDKGVKGWLKRWFFTAIGQVPLDRTSGHAAIEAIETGVRILNEGMVLGIYPEGTRSRDGKLHKGKTGIARMALESGARVIPVAMIGTDKINPIGSKVWRPGQVQMVIGEPLDFSRYEGMAGDRFVERSVVDEVMYSIMALSGQEYKDDFADKAEAA